MFGELDQNITIIEDELDINVRLRDGKIKLIGRSDKINIGEKLIFNLIDIIKSQDKLDKRDIIYTIDLLWKGEENRLKDLLNQVICITSTGKSIKPKTLGQKRYADAMKENDIVLGIGPAGTGKTYLAMAMAVQAFKNKEIDRIILT